MRALLALSAAIIVPGVESHQMSMVLMVSVQLTRRNCWSKRQRGADREAEHEHAPPIEIPYEHLSPLEQQAE